MRGVRNDHGKRRREGEQREMRWIDGKLPFLQWSVLATSAPTTRGPKAKAVASPPPDVNGALQVNGRIAWGPATGAVIPIDCVDLPNTNVVALVPCVVVRGMCVSRALVGDNASATFLIPSTEGLAPRVDVNHAASSSAGATRAIVAGTIAAAGVGKDSRNK